MSEMTAQVMQVDSRRRIARDEVWELAAAEYRRMLELLRTLGDGDWTRPTEWANLERPRQGSENDACPEDLRLQGDGIRTCDLDLGKVALMG